MATIVEVDGEEYIVPTRGETGWAEQLSSLLVALADASALDVVPLTVKDEGVTLTPETTSIDFVGGGVTVTNVGGAVEVSVPAATSLTAKDEGITLTAATSSLDFVGGGVTASHVGGAVTVTVPAIVSKDEGVALTAVTSSIDYVGGGVTATNVGGAVTVSVPASNLTVKDEGVSLSTAVTSIDIVGAGVTATGTTSVTVTIPQGATSVAAVGSTPSASAGAIVTGVLTLQPSSASFPGLMSASDFTKLAGIATGATAGVTTVGAFGASPTANALSISTTTITAQPADATHPGAIALGTQTLGNGTKTVDALVCTGDLTVNTNALKVDSANKWVGIGVVPDRPLVVIGSTNGANIFSLAYFQNTNNAGASTIAFDHDAGTFRGRVGWVNTGAASYAGKMVLQSSTTLSLYTGADAAPVEALAFTTLGLGTFSQATRFNGNVGFGQAPTALLDLGTSVANTKLALYGGGTAAGIGVQSADIRHHLDFSSTKFSWRPTPAGSSIMELSGLGVLTVNSNTVLDAGNTVTGITNKTFTSPTINGATFSGTLGGNATLSGNLTLSGANSHTGTSNSFTNPITYGGTTGLTAFATGGQASATALTKEVSYVTTVASANDSVKLLTAALGVRQVVFNLGANAMNVYPASGGAINALGSNNPYSLAAGLSVEFWGQSSTQWRSR